MDYLRWKQLGDKYGYIKKAEMSYLVSDADLTRAEVREYIRRSVAEKIVEFLLREDLLDAKQDTNGATTLTLYIATNPLRAVEADIIS